MPDGIIVKAGLYKLAVQPSQGSKGRLKFGD